MDRTEAAYGAWFQKIPYIGAKTLFALKKNFGSLKTAYGESEERVRTVLKPKQYEAFFKEKEAADPVRYLSNIEKQGIRYISYFDDIFPEKLRNIPDIPYGIFVKGSLPDEGKPAAAIVGARACSEYGRKVAEEFGYKLGACGVQIISGMARGVDSYSQKACVMAGGHTFAVLGNGVDICYPSEFQQLYNDLQQGGGLISTYAPGMPPVASNFPPRNRIISGLADVVLVVEARKKSGTLITVDMALEQGKEVAIIPGRITDSLSQGCHQLIKQGAGIIVDVEQLMELLSDICKNRNCKGISYEKVHIKENSRQNILDNNNLNEVQKNILELLFETPSDYVEAEKIYHILRQKGFEVSFQRLMEALLDLELMDLCKSNKNCFTIR